MKEIEKKVKVYVSEDGREFLDRDECEKYDRQQENIKYFVVQHTPDLNETGLFMSTSVVAVYSETYGHHADILRNWCVKTKGYPILCKSVQGCGWQNGFSISEKSDYAKELWKKYAKGKKVSESQPWTFPTFADKVFLSPIEIDGFPKPFNYIEEWELKK